MIIDAVVALATVALVVVTGVYVILTSKLAKFAAESAEHSRVAAEAAVKGNSLSLAMIPVEFVVALCPKPRNGNGLMRTLTAIDLTATQGGVWLHSIRVAAILEAASGKWIDLRKVFVEGLEQEAGTYLNPGQPWTGNVLSIEGGFHREDACPFRAVRLSVIYSIEFASTKFEKMIEAVASQAYE